MPFSLWKALCVVILLGIVAFIFIHFLYPSKTVTLPSGQTISLDAKAFQNAVNQFKQTQTQNNNTVKDLAAQVQQLNDQVMKIQIPQALKQTDITKSVKTMLEAW